MSKRKFIIELVDKIQKDPNYTPLVKALKSELEMLDATWAKYKRWGTIAVLIASITYNVLQTLGIW